MKEDTQLTERQIRLAEFDKMEAEGTLDLNVTIPKSEENV